MKSALEVLQAAFEADPNAMQSLMVNRVPCNQALVDDPYVICGKAGDNGYQVGILGLLNGILVAIGQPKVAGVFSNPGPGEVTVRLVGFRLAAREPADEIS